MPINWGFAEMLAYGSLIEAGYPRLSGFGWPVGRLVTHLEKAVLVLRSRSLHHPDRWRRSP